MAGAPNLAFFLGIFEFLKKLVFGVKFREKVMIDDSGNATCSACGVADTAPLENWLKFRKFRKKCHFRRPGHRRRKFRKWVLFQHWFRGHYSGEILCLGFCRIFTEKSNERSQNGKISNFGYFRLTLVFCSNRQNNPSSAKGQSSKFLLQQVIELPCTHFSKQL